MEHTPVTPVANRVSSGSLSGGLSRALGGGESPPLTRQLGSALGGLSGPQFGASTSPPRANALIETPKGPPLARVATAVPGVHMAQYSNVDVLELDAGGTTVMRRASNGSVNATQILKLAGLDRSRRQKALERDIGPHFEIIKGGTGKYQGTWVPLGNAVALAQTYGVGDILRPLFEFDLATRPAVRAPTQFELEQHRRELASQGPSASAVAAAAAAAAFPGRHFGDLKEKGSEHSGRPDRGQLDDSMNLGEQSMEHSMMGDRSMIGEQNESELEELSTFPPLETPEGDELAETSREVVTELFLSANRGETRPLSEILRLHAAEHIEPDVPIDDAGHTALHWAAALGKVSLVADLVGHGANCRRGNRKGESPLVRSVLVTNSSDNQTFGDLLDLLFPCLHLGDAQGRTVLHHIALTAGIPGRSEASRYYLDALLEWAVRCRGASGVKWLVDELVDAQDANGDTALNIAARLGSKRIAQQLVEIGASASLPNRAGLRPVDFGIPSQGIPSHGASNHASSQSDDGQKPSQPSSTRSSRTLQNSHGSHSRSGSRAPVDGAERRRELAESASAALADLDNQLGLDLAAKDRTLQAVHARLKEVSTNLDSLLAQKDGLDSLKLRRDRARQQMRALELATSAEIERFDEENSQHFASAAVPDMHFDADQPFRIASHHELRSLPPVLLRARISAYKHNELKLIQLRNDLRASSLDGEAKYRRVVAQCTSSEESQVDDILEDLLAAVAKGEHEKPSVTSL